MGGEREVNAAQLKRTTDDEITECGKVRYHEKDGEVHFHDDANSLKTSIPSGVWFKRCQSLLSEVPNSFTYADVERQTILNISIQVKKPKKKKKSKESPHIEMEMYIEKATVSDELTALRKFTEG